MYFTHYCMATLCAYIMYVYMIYSNVDKYRTLQTESTLSVLVSTYYYSVLQSVLNLRK